MANTNNNTPKLTKAQKFAMLREIPGVQADPMLVDFIDHEIELLQKKNSAEKKPTAQQVANTGIKNAIKAALTPGKQYTVTEVIKAVPACEGMANQKISALLSQMSKSGEVIRSEDKRKAYFSVPLPSTEGEGEEA